MRFVLTILVLFTLLIPSLSEAQCYKVAITIASGVTTKTKPAVTSAGLGAVLYRIKNGQITILEGSTMGFAAGTKKKASVKSSGKPTQVSVDGDITGNFKNVSIRGVISYPTKKRGNIPAVMTISALGLKLKAVKRGKKTVKEFTGKTSVMIVDATTGAQIYKQKALKFSDIRGFGYEWAPASCFNDGVKR